MLQEVLAVTEAAQVVEQVLLVAIVKMHSLGWNIIKVCNPGRLLVFLRRQVVVQLINLTCSCLLHSWR